MLILHMSPLVSPHGLRFLPEARKIIRNLKEDKDFYQECSIAAKQNYKEYYHEDQFNTTWKKQFKVS